MAIIKVKHFTERDIVRVSSSGELFMECKGYELDMIIRGISEAIHYYGAMLPKVVYEEEETC